MAKAKSQPVRRTRTAHQTDTDRWSRLFIVGGVAAVIVLAVGIIAFGWYWTQVRPLSKTVLQVGKTEFSLGHLQARMSVSLQENPSFRQSEGFLRVLPDLTLAQLEREAKLLEAAHELNKIAVTNEELDKKILEAGGGGESAVLAEELNRLVKESGLNETQYLQMVRAELLEEKVRTHFTSLAPKSEPQVRARWMFFDDEKKAEEALERLKKGEGFEAVARDVSQDTTTAPQGGLVEWRPRGGTPPMPEAVEKFLFEDAKLGQRSEIISEATASYIALLVNRDGDRELSEQQKPQVVERQMNEWLLGLDKTLTIERNLSEEDALRALTDVLTP